VSLARRAIDEYGACQKEGELEQLIAYLADTPLQRVLEIGFQDGGTSWCFCQLAKLQRPDAIVIAVDLEIPKRDYSDWWRLHYLQRDSHEAATFERIRKILRGLPLDLLFIDGDHSYAGVKQDFDMYSPLVRPGGVIALHDVVTHEHPEQSEVDGFWRELLPGHPEALQFVDDGIGDTWRGKLPVKSCGIGVIRQA
jgi:cephalosporin hydroxylase